MPTRHLSCRDEVPRPLRAGLKRLRAELGVPDRFPEPVEAEAAAAVSRPRLPEVDVTSLPFVTIDPPGARDLDQAVHLAADADGFVVHYAIADVAAFVSPGGAVDAEAHRRGETLYAPNSRTPLHPPVLSEDAVSLLPGQLRPALVWRHHLDADGNLVDTRVERGLVRSRAQLSYADVQQSLDNGSASEQALLLRQVGLLRERLERERGGVSLPVPEQQVVTEGDSWRLAFRQPLPVEGWNAQLSLLTGMAAAKLMLEGGVGVLRTMPAAADDAVARLRRTAAALRITWPRSMPYPDFVRSLVPSEGTHAAMLNACTLLFRGAGYQSFQGAPPEQPTHAAIAAPYAHCTAPLRRLVDRYTGETCLALCAEKPVPGWVNEQLETLPREMEDSSRRGRKYERGIVDLVEALVLAPRMGLTFVGTVVEVDAREESGLLQLKAPAVEARIRGGGLSLGDEVGATLVAADLLSGKVEFRVLED